MIIFGCSTKTTKLEQREAPLDIFADFSASAKEFQAFKASGKLMVEGDKKLYMDASAMFGIKVFEMLMNGNALTVNVDIQRKSVDSKNFFADLQARTGIELSADKLTSLFKSSIPLSFIENDKVKKDKREDGKYLYSLPTKRGIEYLLLDSESKIIQYQQKIKDSEANFSMLFSDYKNIGDYSLAHKFVLKIPATDSEGVLELKDIQTKLPYPIPEVKPERGFEKFEID
ncbi:MAG: hypothetical protein Kapaf2KO_22340 [Candidatus Kapaibacteriales bacterium]